jgi:hypothetical protein
MKTATLPALRVSPKLRSEAESVLLEGETISSFIESSIKANISLRLSQQAFIERGMQARTEAIKSQVYFSSDAVINDLNVILQKAKHAV